MLDVFLKQKCTKVIVGDTHQQIYSWRYAVNSLQKAAFTDFPLSTSFRFGQDIASLGAEILLWKGHLAETKPVSIIGQGKSTERQTVATIARTNLGLLLSAITYIQEHKNVHHLYFEGNIHSYTYADDGASLYDVLNLYNGKHDRIRDKLIGSMKTMADLEEYIEKTEDMQLGMMVEVVNEYGNDIPGLIKELKSKHVGDSEKSKAEMIFSTVHRCKGMEYDMVALANDFITEEKLKEEKEDLKNTLVKWNEEINLLYVAVTRTKTVLYIPETLLPRAFAGSKHIQVIKKKKEAEQENLCKYKNAAGRHGSPNYHEALLAFKTAGNYWAEERDDELRKLFHGGVPVASLAKRFGSKAGTILSRLKKIGCLPEA